MSESGASLVCASRHTGKAQKSPLSPIPVAGPFDCLGVDIIQFPCSYDGNKYAIVFMDYLTKWPELFPVPTQTAETIARALVEVISRHGVPAKLLYRTEVQTSYQIFCKKFISYWESKKSTPQPTTHRVMD